MTATGTVLQRRRPGPPGDRGAASSMPQDTDHTVFSIQQRPERGVGGLGFPLESAPRRQRLEGLEPHRSPTSGKQNTHAGLLEEKQPPHPPARNEASAF